MDASQSAWVLGIGSLTSGLSQPVCAWASDRFNTRTLGSIGVALAAVFLSLLGAASDFGSLLLIYSIGIFGVGMFHPVGASSMGQLTDRRRSVGLSAFFVAGMAGWMIGAAAVPRAVASPAGFRFLPFLMIPGLLLAYSLHRAVRNVPHRASYSGSTAVRYRDSPANWAKVGLLFVAAAIRFSVNMALLYVFVQWMQADMGRGHPNWAPERIANAAAPMIGNLNAFTVLGMVLGGVGAGILVRPGREKWPLVLVPILFAPAIWRLPTVPLPWGYPLATCAGIGFASMVPVGMALSQRLLPHRTSLASSLMLGGAWAVAMVGPRLAAWGLDNFGVPWTFRAIALALVVSGLVMLPLRSSNVRD
jgi:MFS family permease